jgi:multiple antibiotic resistance protein
MIDFVATFVFFFAVIDPIGTVPVFIFATRNETLRTRRRIAIRATFFSTIILLFFVVAGEVILDAMDIPLTAFQIAGGIILFLFALSMIFGDSKPQEEIEMAKEAVDSAIFPLAVPSIASPGAMLAAVLLTENARYSVFQQIEVACTMLAVLSIAGLLMLLAGYIQRVIGNSGTAIISKIMGMILASLAVSQVLMGIKSYFGLG